MLRRWSIRINDRKGRIAMQPLLDIVVIELLRPEHPGQGLSLNTLFLTAQSRLLDRRVKRVGLLPAARDRFIEVFKWQRLRIGRQAKPKATDVSGPQINDIMGGGLGPLLGWIDRTDLAGDNESMKSVFDIRRAIGFLIESFGVGFVFGKQKPRGTVGIQMIGFDGRMDCFNRRYRHRSFDLV